MTRLLGIDLGERRIGLAVGDVTNAASRPLTTIRRGTLEADAERIARVVAEQGIGELVVGLPRNMDGSEGPQALATRAWADALSARLELPVVWRDERLTSETAELEMGRVRRGRSGGPPSTAARTRRRAAVDREAARLIVEAELRARAGAVR